MLNYPGKHKEGEYRVAPRNITKNNNKLPFELSL